MNLVNPRYKSIADNSRARLLPDKMLFCIYQATRLDRSLLKLSVILSCQLRSGSGCWGSGSWAGERSVYKIGISHWLNKLAYAALERLQLCTWLLTNNTTTTTTTTSLQLETRLKRVLNANFLKAASKASTTSSEEQHQLQEVLHQLLSMLGQNTTSTHTHTHSERLTDGIATLTRFSCSKNRARARLRSQSLL